MHIRAGGGAQRLGGGAQRFGGLIAVPAAIRIGARTSSLGSCCHRIRLRLCATRGPADPPIWHLEHDESRASDEGLPEAMGVLVVEHALPLVAGYGFGNEHDDDLRGVPGLLCLEVAHERIGERPVWRVDDHHGGRRLVPGHDWLEPLTLGHVRRHMHHLHAAGHRLPDADGLCTRAPVKSGAATITCSPPCGGTAPRVQTVRVAASSPYARWTKSMSAISTGTTTMMIQAPRAIFAITKTTTTTPVAMAPRVQEGAATPARSVVREPASHHA